MGNRYRSSFSNLLLKKGNYTAVAAQDVTEANSHKLCPRSFRPLILKPVLPVIMQQRQRSKVIILADSLHALNNHFAQSLACTHDVCRVDGLVRTDENEPFNIILKQATAVTNGPYQRHKIELIAILTDKFLLNGIGIVLVNVKDNELLRIMCCNLPA